MKKHILGISIFFGCLFYFQNLKAQCSNGNTHAALDTYWHYRYRLINYFMQVGEGTWDGSNGGFGQSLPAYVRNYSSGPDECGTGTCANGYRIWWSDVGRNLGFYIGTLATEYYLLNNYNINNPNNLQNTNETVMELFYALHAVFRLDSIGIIRWINDNSGLSIDPSIISNVQTANPIITFPGKGYMMQDDIPDDFYNNVNPNPVPAITDPTYGGFCQTGSGLVGPVSQVEGTTWSCFCSQNGATSQDNYYALLMGLALTVKLLQPLQPITSFYYSNSVQANFASEPYYSDLCSMARELGEEILIYIFNCGFQLKYPNGSGIGGTQLGGPYCLPLEECADKFFGYTNATTIGCPFLGTLKWDNYTLCNIEAFQRSLPAQNIEMGCELAAMSNDGYGTDGNVYAIQVIENLGNYTANPCSGFTNAANEYGENILYEAINQVLYPLGEFYNYNSNICNMEEIINSAPWDGPYLHQDYNQNPFDYAGCGWASPNRFIWGTPGQEGDGGDAGNYNGLDYMLFYNLYNIVAMSSPPPNTVPDATCTVFNPVFPYSWSTSSGTYIGDCSPFEIQDLTVEADNGYGPGNLTIQGTNFGIDFKAYYNTSAGCGSNPAVIHVEYDPLNEIGGTLHAYCPISCCNPPSNSYIFEPEGSSNYRVPIGKADSSYEIGSEFATKPDYDAIIANPNPFHGQIKLDFSVNETTPISIVIYDMKGKKVVNIIANQVYKQGNYAQYFDGSSLAPGSYLCVMITRDNKKTISIIKN